MTTNTKIEWTDRTWNPVRGCSRVSPGCDHCYAEGIAARFSGPGLAYEGLAKMVHGQPHWTGKIALVEADLLAPLRWKKPCRVFVNSMSDLFHEGVPDSYIDRVFAVMALCPHLTFQILTKRSQRMREYMQALANVWSDPATMPEGFRDRWDAARKPLYQHFAQKRDHVNMERVGIGKASIRWPLPNVWLGVSPCDQATADALIPDLLATPAAVRFISAEPLLGAMDLKYVKDAALHQKHIELHQLLTGDPNATYEGPVTRNALTGEGHDGEDFIEAPENATKLDLVICGGESGRGARPMHPDWARSLRDQCVAAGVAFFFKQWGEWGEVDSIERTGLAPMGWSEPYREDGGHPRIEVQRQDGKGVDALYRVGKKRAGRVLDGRTWDQMPGVEHGAT